MKKLHLGFERQYQRSNAQRVKKLKIICHRVGHLKVKNRHQLAFERCEGTLEKLVFAFEHLKYKGISVRTLEDLLKKTFSVFWP